jgi:hypothetical protein
MKIASKAVDLAKRELEFKFSDGKRLVVRFDELTPDMVIAAGLHGLSQAIGDTYSGIKNAGDAYETAAARWDCIRGGSWSGGRNGAVGYLAEAVAEHTGVDVDAVREKLRGMDGKTKTSIRANPEIAVIIKRLEMEAAEKRLGSNDGITDLAGLFGATETPEDEMEDEDETE